MIIKINNWKYENTTTGETFTLQTGASVKVEKSFRKRMKELMEKENQK